MVDVEMIIQLVPNFMLIVLSNGSYGSCDLLPQLWHRFKQRQDKHFISYVSPQEKVTQS
jgi:hypothetical protein